MSDLSDVDTARLIQAIAMREGTARQLARQYGVAVDELKRFTDEHYSEILSANMQTPEQEKSIEPTPTQLADLWISQKFERIWRMQQVCNKIANERYWYLDTTLLREYRSYLRAAAEELGQLLHRGAGESSNGEVLSVEVHGVDLETLK